MSQKAECPFASLGKVCSHWVQVTGNLVILCWSSVLILSSSPGSAEIPRWLWQSPGASPGPCFLLVAQQIFGSSLNGLILLMFNAFSQTFGLSRLSRGQFPNLECWIVDLLNFLPFVHPKNGKQHYWTQNVQIVFYFPTQDHLLGTRNQAIKS